MPRRDPEDLIGIAEVARILAASRSTVERYLRQGKLPEPVQFSTTGHRKWYRGEIEARAKQYRRREAVRDDPGGIWLTGDEVREIMARLDQALTSMRDLPRCAPRLTDRTGPRRRRT